jgi:hypothetical protein
MQRSGVGRPELVAAAGNPSIGRGPFRPHRRTVYRGGKLHS